MRKTFHYGGQAVIEGVMIRGQSSLAMAVRRPNGEVALSTREIPKTYSGRKRQIPFVRGIVVLLESLVLGVQSLFQSANISLEEEETELSTRTLVLTMMASLGFAVALFFLTPLFLTELLSKYINSSVTSNIVEGVIRIAIFALYLGVINLMPSIRRVFSYHGAEHKVVNAYEDGALLEVNSVRKYSTAHTRCGTGFLLIILVVAIIVFTLLGHPPMWLRILSRIVFIPVIAAIGYEINHFGAMHANNPLMRIFIAPGMALQSITTREPDDSQLEIAIAALKAAVNEDQVERVI